MFWTNSISNILKQYWYQFLSYLTQKNKYDPKNKDNPKKEEEIEDVAKKEDEPQNEDNPKQTYK